MNRREIFDRIMNFEEVGRVLVDQGRQVGSIHKSAYPKIREVMGLPPVENFRILDRQSQCVWSDEDLLEAWNIDFRWIVPKWINVTEIDENTYRNTFGTIFKSANGDYNYIKESPMREAEDLAALVEEWPYWPDPKDLYLVEGLKEQAEKLYNETDYIIGLDGIKGGILQTGLELRGYDQLFVDVILDPDGVKALLDKLADLYCEMYTVYLNEVGKYGQLIYLTDDLGAQNSLLMSPTHIRELVLPYTARVIKHIKSLAPHLKVEYHTDGSVLPIIGDLIDIGVDILNPVQTSVEELKDTAALNKAYGDRIAFHGAMDVQNILINSTPAEIEEEVKKRLKDLGTGGGFIISTCHNINRDIPPQNLKTMYETIAKYSSYPFNF
jgi:uroporphyrinogen decarboxylase